MAEAEDSASSGTREMDYVKQVSRYTDDIAKEADMLSDGVKSVTNQLTEIDSSVQKLPLDTEYGRKSRENTNSFKAAFGKLDEPNKALVKDCQGLANDWKVNKEFVRRAREPCTLEEAREMVEQLKVLLKKSKQWQVDCVSFQEKLNGAQRACKEAEDVCAEAAEKEKDKQTTAMVVGGVTTTVLVAGCSTAGAVVVATGVLTAPVILSAAAVKITTGVLGVGTVVAAGVTVMLSIEYGNLAEKYRDSNKKFNLCSTQLSFLGSNITTLQRATMELIDQLEVGKKLHRDSLATKEELARYKERYGPLQ